MVLVSASPHVASHCVLGLSISRRRQTRPTLRLAAHRLRWPHAWWSASTTTHRTPASKSSIRRNAVDRQWLSIRLAVVFPQPEPRRRRIHARRMKTARPLPRLPRARPAASSAGMYLDARATSSLAFPLPATRPLAFRHGRGLIYAEKTYAGSRWRGDARDPLATRATFCRRKKRATLPPQRTSLCSRFAPHLPARRQFLKPVTVHSA